MKKTSSRLMSAAGSAIQTVVQTNAFRATRVAILATAVVATAACAKPGSDAATSIANNVSDSVGCQSFQSDFYDQLYQFPQSKTAFPSEADARAAFEQSMTSGALKTRLQNLSESDRAHVSEELGNLYTLLTVNAMNALGETNGSDQEKLSTLAALELGDSSTAEKESLQAQIKAEFTKIDQLTAGSGANCTKAPANTPDTTTAPLISEPSAATLFTQWKATRSPIVYGALKTMATAYQSCYASQVPALTNATPDAVGISVVGMHPDGVGKRRQISNMNDLMKTNPYLENYQRPSSSCYDVTKNVPIYNYGGRPQTSKGTFDLFKSSGSGTSALGTDCSGYVYMSIATSGLRVKKSTPLKAVTINGITSTLFTNPQKNGLTCFDYVSLNGTNTMRAGDIIAKAGHVVVVQSVGADPFGIKDITKASDCTLANMSIARIDFTLLQDSPAKGGIGIQASRAADYFPSEPDMASGVLQAAVTACKAKFGTVGTAKNSQIAIVRHSGTSECMNASEIKMEHESCVASCPALASAND